MHASIWQVGRTLIRARFSALSGRWIASGSADGTVHVYDTLTGCTAARLPGHEDVCRDVSWHPDRDELASTSVPCAHVPTACSCPQWDGTVRVWRHVEEGGVAAAVDAQSRDSDWTDDEA